MLIRAKKYLNASSVFAFQYRGPSQSPTVLCSPIGTSPPTYSSPPTCLPRTYSTFICLGLLPVLIPFCAAPAHTTLGSVLSHSSCSQVRTMIPEIKSRPK
ncbi:hypothetical protein FB451DRAFT_1570085, partial [Mycena latifolia]